MAPFGSGLGFKVSRKKGLRGREEMHKTND